MEYYQNTYFHCYSPTKITQLHLNYFSAFAYT